MFSQQLHAGRSAVLKDAELLPLVPADRRCNQRLHRQRQRPGATAAASRWAVAAGPSRQPPALSLPRPLNNSMCTGDSCAFRAGFAHSGRTGNTAYQA